MGYLNSSHHNYRFSFLMKWAITLSFTTLMLLQTSASASVAIMVPCKEGIILVSDKLVQLNQGQGQNPGYNKVTPVGKHCVIALTGKIFGTFTNGARYEAASGLASQVVACLSSSPTLRGYEKAIAANVERDYDSFLTALAGGSLSENRRESLKQAGCIEGNALFNEWAVNYSKGSGQFELLEINGFLGMEALSGIRKFRTIVNYDLKDEPTTSFVRTIGYDRITSQIRSRVHKSAESKWAKRFFFDNVQTSTIEKAEAIDAASQILKLVHEDAPTLVGSSEDVLLLTPSGVNWEFENTEVDQVLRENARKDKSASLSASPESNEFPTLYVIVAALIGAMISFLFSKFHRRNNESGLPETSQSKKSNNSKHKKDKRKNRF